MPNPYIRRALEKLWIPEAANAGLLLDLSCGGGEIAAMLSSHGFRVVATEYRVPPVVGEKVLRVGGVDLNEALPFKSRTFDGVNLAEVIEHIEHQAQLIREIARVLKERGVLVLSTPNVLNVMSRLRFLFTGFLRGRVRPIHYSRPPGQAPNAYLIHFYELYYLLTHSGFEIEKLERTRVKLASLFFLVWLYPLMWLCSFVAVIVGEKDPVQRRLNWEVLRHLFSAPLLLSDNLALKARKRSASAARSPVPYFS
jgi:2-polyprenyl-3-methyl-5-hydroxy-6-metoxy-1,4-benzoquinol methylase